MSWPGLLAIAFIGLLTRVIATVLIAFVLYMITAVVTQSADAGTIVGAVALVLVGLYNLLKFVLAIIITIELKRAEP